MSQKTFAIHTLGCKVNTYESDAMAEQLRRAGFQETAFSELADVYIINTCTVTNIADRKSRQMLHRARKLNQDALVVATGCYVDAAKQNEAMQMLLEDRAVDLFISNREKPQLLELIESRLSERETAGQNGEGSGRLQGAKNGKDSGSLREAENSEGIESCQKPENSGKAAPNGGINETAAGAAGTTRMFLTQLDGHTRAFLKVQDGCRQFCSYCIIPYVRGSISTRPVSEVVEEVRALAEQGVTEIVLNGIHLSSYGKDLLPEGKRLRERPGFRTAEDDIMSGADAPLLSLIEAVSGVEGICRIRLGSLEPRLMTEDFTRRLASFSKICPQFHLSLQSGCDRTLRRMNRHYTTADYRKSCELLRRYFQDPAITTDLIVGFPGETEADFEESCRFVESLGLYEVHVFKYSRRAGTAADKLPDQLTEAVKAERSERLLRLTEKLSHGFRQRRLGTRQRFLCEETVELSGEAYVTGFTADYVRCLYPKRLLGEGVRPGQFLEGEVKGLLPKKVLDESLLLG